MAEEEHSGTIRRLLKAWLRRVRVGTRRLALSEGYGESSEGGDSNHDSRSGLSGNGVVAARALGRIACETTISAACRAMRGQDGNCWADDEAVSYRLYCLLFPADRGLAPEARLCRSVYLSLFLRKYRQWYRSLDSALRRQVR